MIDKSLISEDYTFTTFDKLGNEVAMGGRIVETAYQVAEHFLNCPNAPVQYAAAYLGKNNIQIRDGSIQRSWDDATNDPNYGIVCATFVSFTLWQSGLIDEATIDKYSYHGCSGVINILEDPKYAQEWQRIDNWSELREGDIVVDSDHTYIYMDGDKMLDQHYCVLTSTGDDYRGTLGTASMKTFIEGKDRPGRGYRYIGKKLGE